MRDTLARATHSSITALPLTAAQYGIWLGQQLDQKNSAYWTAEAIELRGALDNAAFTAAIRHAVAECDALHMRFHTVDGVPCQRPAHCTDIAVHTLAIERTAAVSALDIAQRWMRQQLNDAPVLHDALFSTALLTLGEQHHIWFIKAHHIILDGFGYALLARRVAAWYAYITQKAALPRQLPGRFIDVIDEDARYRQSTQFETDRAFWRGYLDTADTPPTLADAAPLSRVTHHARGVVTDNALAAWRAAAQACGTDWTAWVTAVIAIWIYRFSGSTDITIGLPVMGRMGSIAASVPCMFMNIVPLRICLAPHMTLHDVAQHAAAAIKNVRGHQRYRYEQLKQDLDIDGRTRRLFGPVVNIMPFDRPAHFADLHAVTHAISAGPVEDIAINITPHARDVVLDLAGNANAYSPAQLTQLRQALIGLIAIAQAHDGSVQQLAATVRTASPPATCRERLHTPARTVLQRIDAHAQHMPVKPAVQQADGIALSYHDLMQQARALAHVLAQRHITPGDRVVVLLPRSNDAVVAMLGIWCCGAVYVPLDADGPTQRNAAILAATKPTAVITTYAQRDDIAAHTDAAVITLHELDTQQCSRVIAHAANDAAYVIYTSGSTGTPNGVEISHGALAHYVAAATQRYGIHDSDRILQFSPLHFDASIEEILLGLCNGATIVLRDPHMLSSFGEFSRRCTDLDISVLGLPTAFWHELVYALEKKQITLPHTLRCVIIGGEAASVQHVQHWHRCVGDSITLINTYGPTETTIVCTSAVLHAPTQQHATPAALPETSVAIGTPLPGLDGYVVDARLQPVPVGTRGELVIAGAQLATRYVDNAALTHRRFAALPWLAENYRAYRTGDIVMQGNDGQLYFCGRSDYELKISGQRVSTEQISAVLLQHDRIHEACVMAINHTAHTQLVAVIATDAALDERALRNWLSERLLAAAVPSQFCFMTALPKNSRGKIDRHALTVHLETTAPDAALPCDFTPLQTLIAECWHAVLGSAPAHLHEDFFALGGRSLQAITLINQLSSRVGCELSVAQLYENPTLVEFCESVRDILPDCGANITATRRAPDAYAEATSDTNPASSFAPLITLQRGASPALFCVYPADGLAWCYIALAAHLRGRAVFGLQAPGITGRAPQDFHQLVNDAVTLIRAQQPHGPYRLLGWSSGGGIAHAIAATLQAQGEPVDLLALMDSYPAACWRDTSAPTRRDAVLMMLDDIRDACDASGAPRDDDALLACLAREGSSLAMVGRDMIERMIDCTLHTMQLYRQAEHPRFDGNVVFFRATQQTQPHLSWQTWQPHVGGAMHIVDIDSDHFSLHHPMHLAYIARVVASYLGDTRVAENSHAR